MKPIDPQGFEAMFRADPDPWNYGHSRFEAYKRRVLLRACGDRTYGRGLELACANGETTRALRPRCLRLLGVDASPSALAEAVRRTAGFSRIEFQRAVLPQETPRGPFDLLVVSELLYYMPEREMRVLLRQLRRATAPGGKIVVLHHVRNFADAAQPPRLAQRRARAWLAERMRLAFSEDHGRFEVVAFDRPR